MKFNFLAQNNRNFPKSKSLNMDNVVFTGSPLPHKIWLKLMIHDKPNRKIAKHKIRKYRY
jgi:hypothetical protein